MPDFKYTFSPHSKAGKKEPIQRISVEPAPGKPERGSSAEASYAVLVSAFSYDPVDGILMRVSGPNKGNAVRPTRWGRAMVGGRRRSALEAAWVIYTGKIPTGRVYPLNGDRTDLRICNLRMEVPA